jgi:hypothetical protein
MQVIMAFLNNEGDCVQCAVDATLACRLNPLAVTEVPAVAHSLLTRGVHSGLLAICGCLLQALEVPIVPLEHLCDFFESDEVGLKCERRARRVPLSHAPPTPRRRPRPGAGESASGPYKPG